ncbi:HAD hydrolase family protein [Escherichia coli]|uniref:HAD family hydrolase n=1 Tax=Escherichia coli TaxID=562 RepID=UPI002882D6FF|nr:HAD hydrolase family protein [Escherichia coli]
MEETGLPKEAIIAFGDSANDFAMFAQAGSGYLVGNNVLWNLFLLCTFNNEF